MQRLLRPSTPLIVLCLLSACATSHPPNVDTAAPVRSPKDSPDASENGEPAKQGEAPLAHSADLVERAEAGRVAEILSAEGTKLETLLPEDFSQSLRVPNIAANTSEMITQNVSGTDIVAVSVEQDTGRILLAVRGFAYAEVGTDLVFLLLPRASGDAPRDNSTIVPVYFDGPHALDQGEGVRPQFDVTRVSFMEGGRLKIETADASGGACELVYGADRTAQSCTWIEGESRRCPTGITPK